MKKRICLLFSLLFLLCGCTAEVNLEIEGNSINESVDIIVFQNNNLTKDQIKAGFRNYVPIYSSDVIVDTNPDEAVSGVDYYTKKEDDLGTGFKINYSYNFALNKYKDARTVKEGFRSSNIQVNRNNETVLLSTDNNGLLYFEQYPDLEKVTINIKSDYPVKENNADVVNNNIYTWNFSRGDKKNIYMLLDTKVEEESEVIEKEENNKPEEENEVVTLFNEHPYVIIILSILLFIVIVLIISKLKR